MSLPKGFIECLAPDPYASDEDEGNPIFIRADAIYQVEVYNGFFQMLDRTASVQAGRAVPDGRTKAIINGSLVKTRPEGGMILFDDPHTVMQKAAEALS